MARTPSETTPTRLRQLEAEAEVWRLRRDGFDQAEIGAQLGLSRSTVSRALAKARQRLTEDLAGDRRQWTFELAATLRRAFAECRQAWAASLATGKPNARYMRESLRALQQLAAVLGLNEETVKLDLPESLPFAGLDLSRLDDDEFALFRRLTLTALGEAPTDATVSQIGDAAEERAAKNARGATVEADTPAHSWQE